MRRHEILFAVLKLPIELALVFGSFFLAAHIRSFDWFERVFGLPPQSIPSEQLLWFAAFGACVSGLVFASSGLYEVRTTTSRANETLSVISGLFSSFLFCIAGIYLGNGYIYTTEIPRLILIMAFLLAFVWIFAERRIADAVQ
ncbi:MAG TPA: hypothetical protein PK765_06730 [bacterium]|nr:hypothetical protein [bacterium]